MDDSRFKEVVERLKEANKVIAKLDPAIRERAFALLEGYVKGGGAKVPRTRGGAPQKTP